MRDFFINALDKLVAVIIVLMIIGVVGMSVMMTMQPQGGILMALGVLIGGGLYVVLLGGFMYLGLGIYHNTRRTADATEAMANR